MISYSKQFTTNNTVLIITLLLNQAFIKKSSKSTRVQAARWKENNPYVWRENYSQTKINQEIFV